MDVPIDIDMDKRNRILHHSKGAINLREKFWIDTKSSLLGYLQM